MAPSQTDIVFAFQKLCCSSVFLWAGEWISDEELAKFLATEPGMFGLTTRHFNRAILGYELFKTCIRQEEKNVFGIYMHKKNVRNCYVSFYYI